MVWKKTWFSYVLWALYSVVVSVAFAWGILLYIPPGGTSYLAAGIVCLFFLFVYLFFFILKLFVQSLGERKLKKSVKAFLNIALFLVVLCIFFIFQIRSIANADIEELLATEYLTKSFVQDGIAVTKNIHGAEWLYLHLLRGLFIFVGNHAKSALWMQAVLQMAGSFFLYAGIKKIWGGISGALGFAGLMLIPAFVSERNVLTPLWMEFFLFAVGFYGVSLFLQQRWLGKVVGLPGYLGTFLFGIYLSGVVYGDFPGILLLLLGVSVLWIRPTEKAGNNMVHKELNKEFFIRTIQVLCLLGGCMTGLVLLFIGSSYGFIDWWNSYAVQAGNILRLYFTNREAHCFIILIAILFGGIFQFFFEKREDSLSSMFFFALGIAGLWMAGFRMPQSKELWLLLLMTICASISMGRSLSRVRKAEKKQEVTGKKETGTEEIKAEEKAQEEEKTEIKFLENPLPGPKKHVARTLDFDLGDEQLMEHSELDYDVKTSDDDDFDL